MGQVVQGLLVCRKDLSFYPEGCGGGGATHDSSAHWSPLTTSGKTDCDRQEPGDKVEAGPLQLPRLFSFRQILLLPTPQPQHRTDLSYSFIEHPMRLLGEHL